MKLKIIVAILFIATYASAQKVDFNKSILLIPKNFTKNANIITRYDETNVVVKSKKSMTVTYKKFVTVYNKYGDKAPFFLEGYDKHKTISKIKILIYDSLGKIIKKVKKKEISDVSAADGFSLFTDDRYKYYKYTPNKYPYSIEISYQVNTSNTAFLPKWYVLDGYYSSVQKSEYTITYPEALELNHREFNFGEYPIEKKKVENKIYYTVSNIEAIRKEPMAPIFSKVSPNVLFALNKFSLAGEEVNAASWQAFGKWMYERLLKGRGELPEETKAEVKALVKGIEDPIERAELVYKYMQDRTRYISVQIGIGGWKPMLSKDVDRLGYGDCKALSYYTKSLLEEANVESLYTIVYSGEKKDIKKDFISVQGNHAILMVPTKKDTIWLECTSQKLPFGQTGATDDRDVLIVNSEGGKIVHTNTYKEETNYLQTIGSYTIGEKGEFEAVIEIKSSGKQYNNHYYLETEKKKDQILHYKEKFSNILDVAIDEIKYTNNKKEVIFTETIKLKATNYAEKIGDDMMLRLNAFSLYRNLPKRVLKRKLPLAIKKGYKKEDVIEIITPKNYKIDRLPKKVEIENKFGKYQVEITKIADNKLTYKRILKIKSGTHSKTEYDNYRKFLAEINKRDNLKIILKKL